MFDREPTVYERCYNFDRFDQNTLIWIDAHPDMHTEGTSLSGYIGGRALQRVHDKFEAVFLLGTRSWEPGEVENVIKAENILVASSSIHMPNWMEKHVHIDMDVLDPMIVIVPYPVEYGWSFDNLHEQVRNLNNVRSWSVSNVEDEQMLDRVSCCVCSAVEDG